MREVGCVDRRISVAHESRVICYPIDNVLAIGINCVNATL
jgi:hypothetical protein